MRNKYSMITEKILKNLEYDKILKEVAKFAKLSGGSERILSLVPYVDFEECLSQLELTKEAERILFEFCIKPLKNFDDTKELLSRARIHSLLEISDIIKVGRILKVSREFYGYIDTINGDITIFKNLAKKLYLNEVFEHRISEVFISDDEIADDATPKLYELRKKKKKINNDIKGILLSFTQNKEVSKYLQDKIITSRKDRFVVPVKLEYRSFVKGLVQDYSQSGSTIFIEPIEVVEKNNELRSIEIEEQIEIERILTEYTEKISSLAPDLLKNQNQLDHFDEVLSKAEYGMDTRSTMPKLNKNGKIDIIKGRHPIIPKDVVVPVSIAFGGEIKYVLISGPNTGGKTVTMKMVGLFSLLAMSGIFVPANHGTEIGYFERIFSDIGDEQSIENSLSTFSSHILTLKEILDNVDEKSLILIDELGAGTDPEEGAALALASLEELLNRGSTGILTTHYGALKEFCYTVDKVKNASMQFDESTYKPTYKLVIGSAGNSKALEIAENLGISKDVLKRAKEHISTEKKDFDLILDSARKEMQEAEEIKKVSQELKDRLDKSMIEQNILKEKLEKEKDRITDIARKEARLILSQATDEADEIILEIKKIKKESEITQRDVIEAGKLKNKLKSKIIEESDTFDPVDYDIFDISSCEVNQFVYVKTLDSVGQIVKINIKKGELLIKVGMVEVSVKQNNLLVPKRKVVPKIKKEKKRIIFQQSSSQRFTSNIELNIIGQRVFDGTTELEQFIDQAVLRKTEKIRIIHGMGTGKLREGVWETLRTNKNVKSYKLAEYNEGGAGATIVVLK